MIKHLNNTLPFEVLTQIFQYINETWRGKMDVKPCLSVCKSWKMAAEQFFSQILIRVDETSLEKLSKDIGYFSHRVKYIVLSEDSSKNVDRTVTCRFWLDIILACPNLTSIRISVRNESEYVRCLMNTDTERLGHIQRFKAYTPKSDLQLSLKYRKTITSLHTDSLKNYRGKDSDDKLVDFISRFPKLNYFIIYSRHCYFDSEFDITQLLEAAPQLQKIWAYRLYEVKSCLIATMSDNLCLTSLTLRVHKMSVNSLVFITTRLKKLNNLYIFMRELTTDVPQEEFEVQKKEYCDQLFDDLKNFTSSIPEVHIYYSRPYDDSYYLFNGEMCYTDNSRFANNNNGDDNDQDVYDWYGDNWNDQDSDSHDLVRYDSDNHDSDRDGSDSHYSDNHNLNDSDWNDHHWDSLIDEIIDDRNWVL